MPRSGYSYLPGRNTHVHCYTPILCCLIFLCNCMKQIFITGGTGYMGRRLIAMLLKKGYSVKALVRDGSQKKLPAGCNYVTGNALDAGSFVLAIPGGATFIQLLGVPHPSPKKKEQFKAIDLASVKASANAARAAGIA